MNRRGFIRGLFGLAALAVAPTIPLAIAKTQQEKFLEEAATGTIYGKTFYLNEPIRLIGIRNLRIDSCRFIAASKFNGALIELEDCEGLIITNCSFENASDTSIAIISPTKDYDATSTIQAAIDAIGNSGNTIRFGSGSYRVSSPLIFKGNA